MQAKTISTHNGSAAHRAHNIRDERVIRAEIEQEIAAGKEPHIDLALSRYNETLIDEKPQEAYRRIFGEALEDYNQSQKDKGRPERCIADYYRHIQKDKKKHAVYEMIVQVGDNKDTGIDNRSTATERKILKKFIDGWRERNPNLELIGAYIHADETGGTIHAHLDYIPVAHGYSRGLATQNGLERALNQQGIQTLKKGCTAQIQWERRENEALERLCNAHGVEVRHPFREKGLKAVHMDTVNYKRQQETTNLAEDIQGAYKANQQLRQSTAELEKKKKNLEWECRKARADLRETKKETRRILVKKVNNSIADRIFPEKIDEEDLERLRLRSKELKTAKAKISELETKLSRSETERTTLEREAQAVHQREQTVIERENRASKLMKEALEGKTDNTNKRLNALEQYCSGMKFKDGSTVLQAFEKQQELQKAREREYEKENEYGMSR